MKKVTLFSTPKPFINPHISMIQRNAIQSWLELGPDVEVILVGNEEGIGENAREFGVIHVPDVQTNRNGTPLVSSIFQSARNVGSGDLRVYINADILVLENFLHGAQLMAESLPAFLAVGQRWDLDVQSGIEFTPGWQARIRRDLDNCGRLHARGGSDYFIFPRKCYTQIPDFAIGRAGWDNWMIYFARKQGWPVIDATASIDIIHQDHDYSHLPGGQSHYRLPESNENVRLGGGARTIFNLGDITHYVDHNQIAPVKFTWERLWRELEIFPLVKMHSYPLAQLAYAIFHPIKAYKDFRRWAAERFHSIDDSSVSPEDNSCE